MKKIIPILLIWLLLSWCSNFDLKAQKEIDKLQIEYNNTSTVVNKLKSDIENKQAHLSYLSGKINNLKQYLWKTSQSNELNNEQKKTTWQSEYQCLWDDFTLLDDDINYDYTPWCTVFEWYNSCYIRKTDWKQCFKY